MERFHLQKINDFGDWNTDILRYFLRRLVGILFGLIDFLRFNVLIMPSTSSCKVGVKKKLFSDEFVR